jgi:hypothetical protein
LDALQSDFCDFDEDFLFRDVVELTSGGSHQPLVRL